VLASTVPLLVFAAIMTVLFERQQRIGLEDGLRDTARALTVAVDRELVASISVLQALASSEHLETGDFRRFYEHAQRVLKSHPGWATISVFDGSGQQIINLLRPFGAPLPATPNLDVMRRTLDTGEPAVSDLLIGPVSKAPIIGITVPVKRDGRVKYGLGAGLDVRSLSRLLSEGRLSSEWLATIVDGRGNIVASTRDIDQWLGRPAPDGLLARSRQLDEGGLRGVTSDGAAMYAAYSHSRVSGWTVALSVPVAVVDGPTRSSLWTLAAGGTGILLVAGLSAVAIGKRIALGMAPLAVPAPAAPAEARLDAGGLRIAEVERAHRAMVDSAAAFRLLFENNPLPMWVYDVDTLMFLEVNVAAVQHYGYARDEFLRMRITDIRPPEEVERVLSFIRTRTSEAAPGLQRGGATWQHRLKDGRTRQVTTASHAIELGGRRAVLIVAIDVTELRQAEASLTQYAERLRILHEIDAAIIATASPAAIAEAVLAPLRTLLGVPRAIVNLFDLQSGEVEWLAAIGRRRTRLGPGVRFPLALMGDVEGLRRGEVQVIDVDALPRGPEVEALLASGVHVYRVVPMIAGGELIGGVSFGGASHELSDAQIAIAQEVAALLAIAITQARLHERVQRQAAELERRVEERTLALSAANEQLEQEIAERRRAEVEADRANRAKSDFLSRMSHELRTPLNAILGFGQLLEMRASQPRERESVEQILKGGRHLLGLINEILDISRIESGRLPLSTEPVEVSEAVRRVVELARPLAADRGVTFHTEGAACDGQYVLADSQRLQQVLLNLVSNGIKYNRDGGSVTIACRAAGEGRRRISVTDTGSGIPAEHQSRLFRPFERLGVETAGVEGTGLGLALTKGLVLAMAGTIGLESTPGQGSTFWIELPETASPAQRSGLGPIVASAPVAGGERLGTVLYVEDNPSNLRLIERVFTERTALRLVSATDGRHGLELAREYRPDLILADLHLPDISGEDVLREVLSDPELSRTPVIIVSADATPGQIKRLLRAGARAYITKPIDVTHLLTHIDAALAARDV
jgi:PAS domain S-box-containing protein